MRASTFFAGWMVVLLILVGSLAPIVVYAETDVAVPGFESTDLGMLRAVSREFHISFDDCLPSFKKDMNKFACSVQSLHEDQTENVVHNDQYKRQEGHCIGAIKANGTGYTAWVISISDRNDLTRGEAVDCMNKIFKKSQPTLRAVVHTTREQ